MTITTGPTRGGARAPARARARHNDENGKRPHRSRPFRAIDGESVTIDGEHRYILLASSDGDTLTNLDGIPTVDCLNWLLRTGNKSPAIIVAFGLNYDVNMMLRDLSEEDLRDLWTRGTVRVEYPSEYVQGGMRAYVLEWIPSKLFAIYTDGAKVKVYDTFGFFQSSFVNALKSWGIGADDFLKQMKDRRGSFTVDELDEITRYSIHENELLVELMEQVRTALHAVDLHPRSWLGAGAIASALLSRHGIDDVCKKAWAGDRARSPELEEDVLMRAYFGGRTEVFRQGVFDVAPIVSWDVNSAYPAEALRLPVIEGKWRRVRKYDPDAEWAVWRVRWNVPVGSIVAPFPFRDKRSIHYPLEGDGWYHAVEVAAARQVYGDAIAITSGYVFEPVSDDKPFAFLADVYAHRQQLKADGHAGEKVLKLGINSVYGKLAQGANRSGRKPRFQDYFWAGAITAGTRAKVMLAGVADPEHLVAIATDGIMFAGGEPQLDERPGLGEWERTAYKDLFVAQPGMYYAHATRGRGVVRHSRGFFTREVKFPTLQRLWMTDGPYGSMWCKGSRFIGLGTALMRNDFGVWRTWETPAPKPPVNPPRPGWRRLSLYSSRKFYDEADDGQPARVLHAPSLVRPGVSDVYVPKYAAVEMEPEQEEFVQGLEQPMRSF